ncbi:hypothetical protein ACHAXT_000704 [Thalassiosira profunda]
MKVDGFTMELVRADTKEAFKEHTSPSTGQVFAEVEPGLDYFVRIASDSDPVYFQISVDGTWLGYSSWFSTPDPAGSCKGRWQRKDGRETMQALRFNLARGVKPEGGAGAPSLLTGKVELSLYRLGEKTVSQVKDFTSSTELTGKANASGKKCVVSAMGSSVLDLDRKPCQTMTSFQKGEHLRTITLHYCTAVGLIVNKILAKPPAPEPEDKKPRVKPERKRKAAIDLTEDDSDDSDDFGEI